MGLSHLSTLFNQGKMEAALSQLEKIEEHYEPDHPDFFEIKLLKAQILLETGKYEKGEKMLNSLLDLGRKGGKLIRLDMVILLSDILWRKGNWDQAFFMIEMGEYDFTKLGNQIPSEDKDRRYAELKRLKGIYYRYTGELDLAIEYFQECLYTAEKTNDNRLLAKIYNLLGLVNHEVGELTKSWTFYSKAYEMRLSINDEVGSAESLTNLAELQLYLGRMEEAKDNFEKAIEVGKRTNSRKLLSKAMASYGIVQLRMGNIEKGLDLANQALNEQIKVGTVMEIGWTFFHLIIFLLNSEYDHLAPIFIDGMDEIYEKNSQNPLLKQQYQLIKATQMMRNDKTIDRAKAQQTFQMISNQAMINMELTIYALIKHAEMLLDELKTYPSDEIVDEFTQIIEKLELIVDDQYALPLLTQVSIQKAKFAILKLEIKEALEIITSVVEVINKHKLYHLEYEANMVHNQVLRKIENINAINSDEVSVLKLVEESELEERVAELINSHATSIQSNQNKPLLFMISEKGSIIFEIKIDPDFQPNDKMINNIMQNLNLLVSSSVTASSPIDHIKHGKFHILSKHVAEFTCHYIFEGESTTEDITVFSNIISKITTELPLIHDLRHKNPDIERVHELIQSIVS